MFSKNRSYLLVSLFLVLMTWGAPFSAFAQTIPDCPTLYRSAESTTGQVTHGMQNHEIRGKNPSENLHFTSDPAHPNGTHFYNVRGSDSDFAAKQLAASTSKVLPASQTEPIFRQVIQKTRELHGNLSVEPMRADGSGLDIKIDYLSPELAATGSHRSISTIPKFPDQPGAQQISVPRIEVRASHDKVIVFSGNSYGRAYGETLVTEGATSHGTGIILSAPASAHDPVMLNVAGISAFYFGPKARPNLVKTLELSLKIAQDMYPGKPISFKLMDKTLKYNPLSHSWE